MSKNENVALQRYHRLIVKQTGTGSKQFYSLEWFSHYQYKLAKIIADVKLSMYQTKIYGKRHNRVI